MCGLAGVFNLDGAPVDPALVARMSATLVHRGPDDDGVFAQGPVGLGFRRLSIIDLSPAGHQPMHTTDGALTVVFNGEIYNHRELRRDLEAEGVAFRSRSDTEVILELYRKRGEAMLDRLRGMFALALWDGPRRRLLVARDRIGIKPLYYRHDGRRLSFASEIKAIVADPAVPREVDPAALLQYLVYAHSFAPRTMFRGIDKLEAGHYLLADERGITLRRFWDVLDHVEPGRPGASAAEVVGEGLEKAVASHMVSDVPVGAFLSGGIDSSAVVAVMSDLPTPVETFSAGFDVGGSYDELGPARVVARAFGTRHHEQILGFEEAAKIVQKLAYHYDEPFADAAAVPTYLIARFARQHVKVVMSGEGSDEILAGYRRYAVGSYGRHLLRLPPVGRASLRALLARGKSSGARRLARFMDDDDPAVRYGRFLEALPADGARRLLRPEVRASVAGYDTLWKYRACFERAAVHGLDPLNAMLYTDLRTWLPDTYLEKLDKATMAVGLEGRVPFLDHSLVEHVFSLPGAAKLVGPIGKYPLKRAMLGRLPLRILARRKHGFSVPTTEWLRGPLREFTRANLLDHGARLGRWLLPAEVSRLVDEHQSGRADHGTPLWILLNLELWLGHYQPGA